MMAHTLKTAFEGDVRCMVLELFERFVDAYWHLRLLLPTPHTTEQDIYCKEISEIGILIGLFLHNIAKKINISSAEF